MRVRIGSHADVLNDSDAWQRMPDITGSWPLTAPVTRVANPFGGLVYIEVPDAKQPLATPAEVTISGAVERRSTCSGRPQ